MGFTSGVVSMIPSNLLHKVRRKFCSCQITVTKQASSSWSSLFLFDTLTSPPPSVVGGYSGLPVCSMACDKLQIARTLLCMQEKKSRINKCNYRFCQGKCMLSYLKFQFKLPGEYLLRLQRNCQDGLNADWISFVLHPKNISLTTIFEVE